MRRFWKEGKWEAGSGERPCREPGDETPGEGAALQRCEALCWLLLVMWERVGTWAQWDSAEAWKCDQKLQGSGGGGLNGALGKG